MPDLSAIIFGAVLDVNDSIPDQHQHFPLIDICISGNSVRLWVDLPGISATDLNVYFKNNLLIIAGIKKISYPDCNRYFHRVERAGTSFCRKIQLSRQIKTESIVSKLQDGVLFISWEYYS